MKKVIDGILCKQKHQNLLLKMTILKVWRTGTVKLVYSSFITSRQHLPTSSLLKYGLPLTYHSTSFRYFSWAGFYYSVSSSVPVVAIQNVLIDLHNFSGLPWWAVISLTTLGIRLFCVFPLAVHQNQVIGRLANLNIELGKIAPELNKEVNIAKRMYGWDEPTAKIVFKRNMKQHHQKIILRDNCHPFKLVLLAVFQVPVWFCFSVSLRNLAINPVFINCDVQVLQQQLKTEGTLWFKDLMVPDSLFLPFLLVLVNLLLIELHSLRLIGKGSKLQKVLLYAMRFFSVIVAYAAAVNPTSVSFYWLCSSTFGLAQNILLMVPRFRRLLRIPLLPNESSTPFKDIAINFRKRFVK